MPQAPYFTPAIFQFLRELKENNDRDWFQANKARYEREVRNPTLKFIAEFAPLLEAISPHFIADPRPHGGSMFRIYRDTRFSKDKSPYKTHVGIQFRHDAGKDVHAPGFYLGIEPDHTYAAAGIWHPDSKSLQLIREAIVDRPEEWRRVTSFRNTDREYTLGGDSLKRPPRGFDAAHPLIDDLKRKDFYAVTSFSEGEVCAPDFMAKVAEAYRVMAPLNQFLTRALGLAW